MQNDSFFSSSDLDSSFQFLDSSSTQSSLFCSYTPPPFSPSPISQSSIWSSTGDDYDPFCSEKGIYLRRLALKYQDIYEGYELCLTRLQKVKEEAEFLRQENLQLRKENLDLTNRLSLLSKRSSLSEELSRMRIRAQQPLQPISENHHVSPPKSISVRSREFLKKNLSGPVRPDEMARGSFKEDFGGSRKTRSG